MSGDTGQNHLLLAQGAMILLELPPMLQNILQKLGLSAHFCSNVGGMSSRFKLEKNGQMRKMPREADFLPTGSFPHSQ